MRSPGRRRWSAAALPLLTLAALFGMHGLGDHTGAHAAEVGHHAMAMAPALTAGPTTDSAADVPSMVPLDTGSVVGATLLCFGILVGAGLALLALVLAGVRPGWDAPLLVRQSSPRPHCRDPAPPSLHVLSVCRC